MASITFVVKRTTFDNTTTLCDIPQPAALLAVIAQQG